MKEQFKALIAASITVKTTLLSDEGLLDTLEKIVNVIVAAYKADKRLFFCGNGGSAADAQHLAAEFTGRFYKDRLSLPAEALHCNTSYLTAVGNDYGFDDIYARMIKGTARTGDVLIGFSTSGNSPNIVKAFEAAKEKGVVTIAYTGSSGGILKNYSDYLLNVPSSDTPRIQECHILLGHLMCEFVEERFFE
ncbi:D-sedoheptulose-7-phosphate isomerase [Flavisolibacter ginsenosidimutans]|uniref:Phosphoheptose isomerase n=1 Tax=Flavisolibacter ginsenosidimutans TaxID=661481 RepID=A0A5B8UKA0_9BACT|nr:SIS domain-containing protein [Flavisolibacter ginsenosidimutans]QEC56599.1 SIS domain-containing protein [Flavisolibacter ginsenosidimutans]